MLLTDDCVPVSLRAFHLYIDLVLIIEDADRRKEITGQLEDIEAWTVFDYPARKGKYSSFQWNKSHFSGVDYDESSKRQTIWRLEGKQWAPDADDDLGNFDYL